MTMLLAAAKYNSPSSLLLRPVIDAQSLINYTMFVETTTRIVRHKNDHIICRLFRVTKEMIATAAVVVRSESNEQLNDALEAKRITSMREDENR